MRKVIFFILILLVSSALWAQQNRHALVIGNASYSEKPLPNAVNDTNDISAALRELGFNVVLKQNLNRLDMVREISAFTTRLRNNADSEGFFWYAGHAAERNGETFLYPLDVNIENDEFIRATSFPLNDLIRQFGDEEQNRVRNKVNVLVLDACRVPPDGRVRSTGDATRVIRTVPLTPSGMFVFYSTAPGTVAYDGEGKRNSPFADAFLKNIRSTEPITIMAGHVTSDTLSLTGNRQRPYTSGSMGRDNVYYSLNPAGAVIPVPEGLEFEIVDGRSVTITKYTGNATTLNIPAQIQGLPVMAIGVWAFNGCSSLTSVTIPSSVTSIGELAFSHCSSLTSVTIPSSVISIGPGAFRYCSNLTNVTIPSSVTSIGRSAFWDCSSLTSITVDNRNPSYASIDSVLFDKNIRTLIKYPESRNQSTYVIPSSVTTIGEGAFSNCRSLTSVTIPSSVMSIRESAFHDCRSLTSVTIPSSVTFIGDAAFVDCESLTNVTIPSSVASIGDYAFGDCSSLTSVTLSRRTQVGENAFPKTARIIYSD